MLGVLIVYFLKFLDVVIIFSLAVNESLIKVKNYKLGKARLLEFEIYLLLLLRFRLILNFLDNINGMKYLQCHIPVYSFLHRVV